MNFLEEICQEKILDVSSPLNSFGLDQKNYGKDWQSESTSVNFSGNSTIDYSVLLQTARAQVASVDGKKSTNSLLLFDRSIEFTNNS